MYFRKNMMKQIMVSHEIDNLFQRWETTEWTGQKKKSVLLVVFLFNACNERQEENRLWK